MLYYEPVKIEIQRIGDYLNKCQKSFSLSIILVPLVIFMLVILFSQLICSFTISWSIAPTYAQDAGLTESHNNDRSINETDQLDSYRALIANNYPYPIHFVQKLELGPAIIHDGIAISKNTKSEEIQFDKWGFPNNLNFYRFPGPNKNITLLYIDGNTAGSSSGFMSSELSSVERYISMNFGTINKYPKNAQITIQLEIVGDKGEYNLNFVNGRLSYEGWLKDTYYEKVSSNSSRLVDLAKLISLKGDRYSYLKQININVEKNIQIDIFQFRIDLGNSTINTPTLVNDGQSYFINGYAFQDNSLINNFTYLLHDWHFKQILKQEFITNPSDEYVIAPNNWNITKVSNIQDNSNNKIHIHLLSEKSFLLWEVPLFEVLTHLDIYNSLFEFGSPKDILFVTILTLLVMLTLRKSKSSTSDFKSGDL